MKALLYSFPIIMPVPIEGDLDTDPKIFLALLIVINAVWAALFITALIHNAIINSDKKYSRESLSDRSYLFVASLACGIVDIAAVITGLTYWVSTLL